MIIARRMTRNPVTATPEMSIGEASDLMKREKVHRLPVLDKDKNLVGVITEKDILHASPSPASSLSRLMSDQDLSCLPVVNGTKLVGIVTKSDMFRILLELFGARHYGVRLSFLVEDKPGTIARISAALADKGLDIISFGTFAGTDPTNAICTIKVQGCTIEELVGIIKPYVSEILDVREV